METFWNIMEPKNKEKLILSKLRETKLQRNIDYVLQT